MVRRRRTVALAVGLALGGAFTPVAVSTPAAVAAGRAPGAVALYRFDEGGGPVVLDRSGLVPALDLTVTEPTHVTWSATGGLRLTGSTGLTTGTAATRITEAIRATGEVTLEAWVAPAAAAPAAPGVIAELGTGPNDRALALTQGFVQSGPKDRFEGTVRVGSGAVRLLGPRRGVATRPTHLVVRRGRDNRTSLFVDGTRVASKVSSGTTAAWPLAFPVAIGADPTGGRGFDGTVQLVAIYARALTDAEIASNRAAGVPLPDTAPPVLRGDPQVDVAGATITVALGSDERAAAQVRVTGAGVDRTVASAAGFATEHRVVVGGLSPGSTYDLTVTVSDPGGHSTIVTRAGLTTTPPGFPDTVFDVWYGPSQRFGHLGIPQRWVNVLGSVRDPDGIVQAVYRLNGGAPVTMGLGANQRRLANPGDFNIDLLTSDLAAGVNTVEIDATDSLGNGASTTVTVDWQPVASWALPYSIDWSAVSDLQDVAQVGDGRWRLDAVGSLVSLDRADTAYDRLLLVGDGSWRDYEARTTVTVVDVADVVSPFSAKPGFGFIVHWNGHNDSVTPGSQPHQGFLPDASGDPTPFGAITWWRSGKLQVLDHQGVIAATAASPTVVEGATYELRMQVQRSGVRTAYRLRIWPAGTAEPTRWGISWTSSGLADEPAGGSLAIVAHEVQIRLGDLTVTPA